MAKLTEISYLYQGLDDHEMNLAQRLNAEYPFPILYLCSAGIKSFS